MTDTATRVDVDAFSGRAHLAALRGEWNALAGRAKASYFQSWAWVSAWCDMLEPAASPVLLLARDEAGELRGLLALARLRQRLHPRFPVRIPYIGLAGSGAGAGDRLGILADSDAAVAPIAAAAARAVGRRAALLESVGEDSAGPLRTALRADEVDRVRAPALDLAKLDAADDAWSKKLRTDLRNWERRLARGGVTGEWLPPGPAVVAALAELAALHAARWSLSGHSGLIDERRLHFLERLADLADPPTGPWLYRMATESEPVGTLLAFRAPTTLAFYQLGWDPAWAQANVGKVMVAHALRFAKADGLDTFDFLRGPEPYKYRFGGVDKEDVLLAAGRGPGARLLRMRIRAVTRRRAAAHEADADRGAAKEAG